VPLGRIDKVDTSRFKDASIKVALGVVLKEIYGMSSVLQDRRQKAQLPLGAARTETVDNQEQLHGYDRPPLLPSIAVLEMEEFTQSTFEWRRRDLQA
jgi:hypothetical protein